MDAMMFDLSQFFRRSDAAEDWLARHLVTESRRGRRLADVLQDPAVVRRCDARTRVSVLDRSDVIEALAENAVARVRAEIARGGMAERRPAHEDRLLARDRPEAATSTRS
jgi:hypothetical protein